MVYNSEAHWMEHIVHVEAFQKKEKLEESGKTSWKKGKLSSLITTPPFVHFFIYIFNKHLLRAECGFVHPR